MSYSFIFGLDESTEPFFDERHCQAANGYRTTNPDVKLLAHMGRKATKKPVFIQSIKNAMTADIAKSMQAANIRLQVISDTRMIVGRDWRAR